LYHNSPYLNEVGKLGYSGLKNRFKSLIIKSIEKRMYLSCDVYFLLKLYVEKIKKIIPNARANWINAGGIAGFTTLYLNKKLDLEIIEKSQPEDEITILIYGSWGPQKDVSKALEAVKIVKDSGLMVKVIVAGGSNLHFSGYISFFEETLANYKEVIDERIGYVNEVDLYSIFERSDLIILPYVVPGGFSGVLSISMLFGLSVIVPEFEEYKEEASGYRGVHFLPKNFSATDIASKIKNILRENKSEECRVIEPAAKFREFIDEVKNSHILG
jgi:glycosyltransferase involved in cell wall biosynthesis